MSAPVSPRLSHNSDLLSAFMTKYGIASHCPKVSEQIETIPLQREKLLPFGYNASIVNQNGDLLMAYRYHEESLSTKIAMAQVLDTGEVQSNWTVNAVGYSIEDPRFFKIGSAIWLSWVESYWPVQSECTVRYGYLVGNELKESFRPIYRNNDGAHMEKNWVWFEYNDCIYFIYQCHKQQIIARWSGQLEEELITEAPTWYYGPIKGGTPPIPYEGKLLRFFHSTLDNDYMPPRRTYFIGALLMEPKPPFKIVAVSKRPILTGSHIDDLKVRDRPKHWKAKVVFPAGAVQRNWGWLLSLGVNDSQIAIAKVKPQNLNL